MLQNYVCKNLYDSVHRNSSSWCFLGSASLHFVQENAWLDVSEDSYDQDVDGEHEKATLYGYHELLPCQFKRACNIQKIFCVHL